MRAVIAESFERIHRSNLVGMGVLPLQFSARHVTAIALDLTGDETFDIPDVGSGARARRDRPHPDESARRGHPTPLHLFRASDTRREAEWVRNGGILPYVVNELEAA